MAVVAARRGDLSPTLRWIATAENTALGKADDVLGVPFLCDVAEMLGALGDLDARRGATSTGSTDRGAVFPGQVLSATFVLDARRGVLGDLDEALRDTSPTEWWRVKLVAAHALAVAGRPRRAPGACSTTPNASWPSLGFGDFDVARRGPHPRPAG